MKIIKANELPDINTQLYIVQRAIDLTIKKNNEVLVATGQFNIDNIYIFKKPFTSPNSNESEYSCLIRGEKNFDGSLTLEENENSIRVYSDNFLATSENQELYFTDILSRVDYLIYHYESQKLYAQLLKEGTIYQFIEATDAFLTAICAEKKCKYAFERLMDLNSASSKDILKLIGNRIN